MSGLNAFSVRDVRRGAELDSIEFTLVDGTVLIAHAHGLNADEALRTRERLLKILTTSLVEVAELR